MSTANIATLYTEFVTANNISAGNTTANITISTNSTAFIMSTNVYINSVAIAVTDNATNTSFINSSSFSTKNLIINGIAAIPQNPSSNIQSFSIAGWNQWLKPANSGSNDFATIYIWAGGGGGFGNNTTQSGGGGGACVMVNKLLSQLDSVCNVYVGSGGIGATTGGAPGTGQTSLFFTNTTFSINSYGGGPGPNNTGQVFGGSGGGWFSAGDMSGWGGSPQGGSNVAFNATSNPNGGAGNSVFGGGGAYNNTGGSSAWGGGGGAGGGQTAGDSIYGGGGGGNTPGTSTYGGNGAQVGTTIQATDGFFPSGGGGCNTTGGTNGGQGLIQIVITRVV